MSALFAAFVAGFCLRGAMASAADGEAWWALLLGVLFVLNAAIAIDQVKR